MTPSTVTLARRCATSHTPDEWRARAEWQRQYALTCEANAEKLRRDLEVNERAAKAARERAREFEAWCELAEELERR